MSDDHALALPKGFILKEYQIERVLGHGGFGITYLAAETNLKRHVAIKEYLPVEFAVRDSDTTVKPRSSADKEDYEWGLERFVQEAGTLAVFRHPAIVSVFRYFEDHGTAYMVMEYEEGESFAVVMRERRGKFTEEELRVVLMPLLEGLAVVHKSGYLHRDIKPGNIYIRTDGSPVLLDFGAARHAIGNKSKNLTSIVTPGYAPMEQYFSDGNQGPWTDIYALAGILYQAVTGDIPPEAPARIKRDPFTALRNSPHAKRFSEPFLAAIDSALEVDEEARPQSVTEWKAIFDGEAVPPAAAVEAPTAALRPAAGATVMPGRVSQRSAPPPSTVAVGATGDRKRVSPLVWVGAGVLGLMVVGAGVVAAVKPELFGGGGTEITSGGTTGAGAGTTGSAGTTGNQSGEEARRRAEELRRQQEEAKRAQEEARRAQEAERKAREEAQRRAREEARRKAEAEARRKAEAEARRKAEAEARRKAEEQARNNDTEERRKAEEAERKRLAEERRKAAEARRTSAEEARRKAAEKAKRRREAARKRQLALGRTGRRCGSGVRALQGRFGRGDCAKITRAFAFALLNPQPGVPINWSNPAIGHRGTVLAYQAYRGRGGALCRPFRQIMVAEGRTLAGNGAACLIRGRWTIVR